MPETKFDEIAVGRGTDLVTLTRWVLAQQQVRVLHDVFVKKGGCHVITHGCYSMFLKLLVI